MDTTRDVRSFAQRVHGQHVATTGDVSPVSTDLSYDSRDPYAVTVAFHLSTAAAVVWVFARDLLCDGLVEPVGDGDVHAWPGIDTAGSSVVMLDLSTPGGNALMELPSADVRGFVDRMEDAVPPGEESAHLDVDGAIAAVLGAGLV